MKIFLKAVNPGCLCPKGKWLLKESLFRISKDSICDLILRQSMTKCFKLATNWTFGVCAIAWMFNKVSRRHTRFIGCSCKAQQLWLFRGATNLRPMEVMEGLEGGIQGTKVSKQSCKAMKRQHHKPYSWPDFSLTFEKIFLVLALRNAEMGMSWSWQEVAHTLGHCPSRTVLCRRCAEELPF